MLVLTASTVADAADDATTSDGAQASFDAERKSNNSANDPTEPRLTLEYWNYYAPSLNNLNGGAENEKVDEASAESWNEILSVNLMSYVFCAKAAVPLMRRNKGGAIVNVASVRSVVAGGGNVQYDTTKAAVAGLTRALAADHSPDGIRVNAVGPGPIFTPFHQRRIAAAGETVEQYNAKAAQGTMLQRPGRAEEVAAAILFLASDDASYVTGALLFVDGGMTAL